MIKIVNQTALIRALQCCISFLENRTSSIPDVDGFSLVRYYTAALTDKRCCCLTTSSGLSLLLVGRRGCPALAAKGEIESTIALSSIATPIRLGLCPTGASITLCNTLRKFLSPQELGNLVYQQAKEIVRLKSSNNNIVCPSVRQCSGKKRTSENPSTSGMDEVRFSKKDMQH